MDEFLLKEADVREAHCQRGLEDDLGRTGYEKPACTRPLQSPLCMLALCSVTLTKSLECLDTDSSDGQSTALGPAVRRKTLTLCRRVPLSLRDPCPPSIEFQPNGSAKAYLEREFRRTFRKCQGLNKIKHQHYRVRDTEILTLEGTESEK